MKTRHLVILGWLALMAGPAPLALSEQPGKATPAANQPSATPAKQTKKKAKNNKQKKPDYECVCDDDDDDDTAISKIKGKRKGHFAKPLPDYELGLGLGFASILLPNPSLQLNVRLFRYVDLGYDFGNYSLSMPQLSIKQIYRGVDLKVFPWQGSFFVGLAYGTRTLMVNSNTVLDKSVQNPDTGENKQVQEELDWETNVQQKLTTPKLGWQISWDNGATIVAGFGLVMAENKDAQTEADISKAPDVAPEQVEAMRQDKQKEVQSLANSPMPLIELRFAWYLDAGKYFK